MTQLYVLFEHASGYGLFKVSEFEEVGAFLPQVEEASTDASKFQRLVQLVGYKPFTSAASALENINAISEGILTSELSAFLETNVPSMSKKSKVQLGINDMKLAAAINEAFGVSVTHVGVVPEIVRGIRLHLTSYVKGLTPASMKQTELGLGHSYSRGKVKFNVNRIDNMIIQGISILDQLDKDINTFTMRMKEWYSYHFPELARIVTDNYQYCLCADFIKDRTKLTDESVEKLEEIVMDHNLAQGILDASKMSMGMDISPIDLMNIERFSKRVLSLSAYRKELGEYLKSKMSQVAPNLATLIGEVVGARLISHSGSLTNLAKYPASTVQILGAEKALFRAIKTKSNTPKYGLIFHASFITRAGAANKGRISRFLANKCSIASRIDCFSENLSNVFGTKLKEQVEERLQFYEKGDIPRKNAEVMSEALVEHNQSMKQQMKKKKRKSELVNGDAADVSMTEESPKKKKKKGGETPSKLEEAPADPETPSTEGKKKKKKKKDRESLAMNGDEEVAAEEEPSQIVSEETPKKKKKKKSLVPGEEAMEVNGGHEEEASPPEGESAKKKKKKKKSLQPDELNNSVGFFMDVNGDQEEEAPAAVTESGKKKKKKKNRESLEAAA